MTAAWTVSDYALFRILSGYLASLTPSSWFNLDLYVNDYMPQPGDVTGNYTIPTSSQWPGYIGQQLPAIDWSRVSVSDHAATTQQPNPFDFVFPSAIQPITIYGYLITDGYGQFQWSERFAAPIQAHYPGGLIVVSLFNVGILPPPEEADPAVIALRSHEDEWEYERE